MTHLRLIIVMTIMLLSASIAFATSPNDDYVAGYAASVLKLKLNLDMPSLIVKDGVITLPAGSVKAADQEKAVQLLSDIPGVKAVKISDDTFQESMAASLGDEKAASATQSFILSTGLLPPGHLFKPLLADPRWAHFSVSYRNYLNNKNDGRNITTLGFGETIPFYRSNFGKTTAQWEWGFRPECSVISIWMPRPQSFSIPILSDRFIHPCGQVNFLGLVVFITRVPILVMNFSFEKWTPNSSG